MKTWFPKVLPQSEYTSVSVLNNAPHYPSNQQKIPATAQNKQKRALFPPIIWMLKMVCRFCIFFGRISLPLSYGSGYLKFSTWFMKNENIIWMKKITLWINGILWKINGDYAACLKNGVNFLVPWIYNMHFSGCFPMCFCVCKGGSLEG